jgi:tetratricopeptide (TPR) repeat protein
MSIKRVFLSILLFNCFSVHADEKNDCNTAVVSKSENVTDVCAAWLSQANSSNKAETIASANLDYAKALMIAGKTSEALIHFNKSLEEAKKSNQPVAIAVSADQLGRFYLNEKRYENALAPSEVAVEFYEKVFGRGHLITLNSLTRLAGVKLKLKDYHGSIEATTVALQAIPQSDSDKFVIVPNLYLIRALSLDNTGDPKAAISSYITAARLMEGFDIASSIAIWKKIKSTLMENNLVSEVGVIERKIDALSMKVKVGTQ